ncbi:alpha/beta fold hydrolase [Aspergillus undulatus]|uniref:alpha/beta fold hydrolase n=1 Tax=Aspergillus undulatus TaxID=1810928 RepID=UPI003CCDCD38
MAQYPSTKAQFATSSSTGVMQRTWMRPLSLLGTFPPGPLVVSTTYSAFLEIPSTYIICENDRALPVQVQERMVAQGKGAFTVERCRCQEGHSPFLNKPAFVVECIKQQAGG